MLKRAEGTTEPRDNRTTDLKEKQKLGKQTIELGGRSGAGKVAGRTQSAES
jgi:hypothetical protein